jgi:DNA repair exonuclease SbcCD ATPase subunit
LTRYGYHSDNGVAYDFAELQKDVKEYRQYVVNEQEREQALAQKRARKEEIERKLTAFFRSYGLSGNSYIKLLSDLRGMVSEYFSLRDRKNTQATKRETLTKTLEEARLKMDAYKRKYRLTELRINEVLEDVREHHRLCAEIEREKAQAAALKEKEGLGEKPTGEKVELSDLQAALTEKQNERSKLEREIEADETAADSVYEKDAKLFELEEKLKGYKQRHKLLKAAKELLESADGKLKDRYVKPIKDEFLSYAAILEKTLGERVVMTKNFEIYFERDGEQRTEKHLSAGQRSICALCFRLALIKNMYKDNMPFLILDDPFVALDKEHMEKVKELLQALSKDAQMVYFTCHESRSI